MPVPAKPTIAEIAYSWLMLPVYLWQGLAVRRRTHRLEPPAHDGTLSFPGQGDPLEVLILGDSSAAGVGVETIGQSFAGMLPQLLAERSGRPVTARIAGMNSATAAHIRDYVVPHIQARNLDFIALNIGTNDAKNFHSGRRFCRDFGTLLYVLRARFPRATIIWSGILDLEQVPALPYPLNRILGIRARLMAHKGRELCRERGALAPHSEWRIVRENFSSDGFHASERGYREWADAIAEYILDRAAAAPAGRDKISHPNVG